MTRGLFFIFSLNKGEWEAPTAAKVWAEQRLRPWELWEYGGHPSPSSGLLHSHTLSITFNSYEVKKPYSRQSLTTEKSKLSGVKHLREQGSESRVLEKVGEGWRAGIWREGMVWSWHSTCISLIYICAIPGNKSSTWQFPTKDRSYVVYKFYCQRDIVKNKFCV